MNFNQLRQFTPQLNVLAKKHGITRIFVFGSVARGDTQAKSDIDFLVEMEEGASLFAMAGFSYETEKILGMPVDVIPLSLLPQIEDLNFVANIQKDAIQL